MTTFGRDAGVGTVAELLDIGGGPAVSITRPDNTDAYTANDVIGHATDATAAIEFTSVGASSGRVMITSASLMISLAAIPSGMTSFRLYLYSVTPPSALADNAAWDLPAGDRASFLGYIDLGSPVDLGSTLYVEANGINKQVKLAGTSLFGYLVTNEAYTPASQTIYKVTLNTTGV